MQIVSYVKYWRQTAMSASTPSPFGMTSLISSLFATSSTELAIDTGLDTVINKVKTNSRILNELGAVNPANIS